MLQPLLVLVLVLVLWHWVVHCCQRPWPSPAEHASL
jgi:hypothetical protein